MKKFLCMLMAVIAITASAHVTESKTFDNIDVTLKGGATALTQPVNNGYEDWAHSIQAGTSLQFTKWITPRWGAAIDGTMGIRNGSKIGAFQSYGLDMDLPEQVDFMEAYFNKINYVTVSALAKYRVLPGKFNIVAAAGPSWVHGFSYVNDRNDIGTKFQVELNYEMTERLALTLVPEYNFNFTANYGNQPKFNATTSWYGLMAGITYHMGDKFHECTSQYSQSDIDALNAKLNAERNRVGSLQNNLDAANARNAQLERDLDAAKKDPGKVAGAYLNGTAILFDKGSAVIPDMYKPALAQVTGDVTVTGSFSPEGEPGFNHELALNRANAVAEFIKAQGKATVKEVKIDSKLCSRVAVVK